MTFVLDRRYIHYVLGWLFIVAINLPGQAIAGPNAQGCKTEVEVKNHFLDMWLYKTNESQETLIGCLESSWQYYDDGEKTISAEYPYNISSYLLGAMQFNLDNFVVEMEKRPALLEKWIKNIQFRSFTSFDDGPCRLQAKLDTIKSLLNSRQKYLNKYPSYQKIKTKFDSLTCRVVE